MHAVDLAALELREIVSELDPQRQLQSRVSRTTARLATASTATVYFELEPGMHVGRHVDSAEELLLILEGSAEATVGDETGLRERGLHRDRSRHGAAQRRSTSALDRCACSASSRRRPSSPPSTPDRVRTARRSSSSALRSVAVPLGEPVLGLGSAHSSPPARSIASSAMRRPGLDVLADRALRARELSGREAPRRCGGAR